MANGSVPSEMLRTFSLPRSLRQLPQELQIRQVAPKPPQLLQQCQLLDPAKVWIEGPIIRRIVSSSKP